MLVRRGYTSRTGEKIWDCPARFGVVGSYCPTIYTRWHILNNSSSSSKVVEVVVCASTGTNVLLPRSIDQYSVVGDTSFCSIQYMIELTRLKTVLFIFKYLISYFFSTALLFVFWMFLS